MPNIIGTFAIAIPGILQYQAFYCNSVFLTEYLILQLLLYRVHTGQRFIMYHSRPLSTCLWWTEDEHNILTLVLFLTFYQLFWAPTYSFAEQRDQLRRNKSLLGSRHMPALTYSTHSNIATTFCLSEACYYIATIDRHHHSHFFVHATSVSRKAL